MALQAPPAVDYNRLRDWAEWAGLMDRNPESIIQGQIAAQSSVGDIYAGDIHISGRDAANYRTEIFMHGGSIASYIELRLRFSPSPQQQDTRTPQQRQADELDRVSIFYPTYVSSDAPDYRNWGIQTRTPHIRLGSTVDQNLPGIYGPVLDFSSSLRKCQWQQFDNSPLSARGIERFPGPVMQHYFTFETNGGITFNRSKTTTHKPQGVQAVVAAFVRLMDYTGKIEVHVRDNPRLRFAYGMHFCGLPFPPPPSYWPFLLPENATAHVMQRNLRTFYQFPDYVEHVFLTRTRPIFRRRQPNNVAETADAAQPIALWTGLPEIYQFTTERQYQTHVLGAFVNEELGENAARNNWYNGEHECYVVPQAACHPMEPQRFALIFIDLNAYDIGRADAEYGPRPDGVLPQVGDRVAVFNPAGGSRNDSSAGTVIAIPGDLAATTGRANCCIRALIPRQAGFVITPSAQRLFIMFGSLGRPTRVMRKVINNLMTLDPSRGGDQLLWLRDVVLARDPYHRQITGDLPNPLSQQDNTNILGVCTKYNLNAEQINVVRSFFTKRLTIVHAPPGTGKTHLVQCIVEIATKWNRSYLALAPSNQAVDVIHTRITNNRYQDGRVFRIYTETQETLYDDEDDDVAFAPTRALTQGTDASGDVPFDTGISDADTNTLRTMFTPESTLPGPNCLSLHLQNRLKLLNSDEASFTPRFPSEAILLKQIQDARRQAARDLMNDPQRATASVRNQRRLELDLKRLYARDAMGNCVTNSSATGKVLRTLTPHLLIQDEAAQGSEPETLAASILFNTSIQHRVMFGDHNQLEPTQILAENIFHNQGSISLQKRLIGAGFAYHTLTTQYRMHPDIAEWSRQTNEPGLQSAPGIGLGFANWPVWQQNFLTSMGVAPFARHSMMISPTYSEGTAVPFGTGVIGANRTLYNFHSAAIIFHVVVHLIEVGNCPIGNILVLAAYSGQVRLLKLMFSKHDLTKDVKVGTWDSSQGSEAEVVIIDPVRTGSNTGASLGFLNTPGRLNVVMTRGRTGRIVVAHPSLIENQPDTLGRRHWATYFDRHVNAGWFFNYSTRMADRTYQSPLMAPYLAQARRTADEFLG